MKNKKNEIIAGIVICIISVSVGFIIPDYQTAAYRPRSKSVDIEGIKKEVKITDPNLKFTIPK